MKSQLLMAGLLGFIWAHPICAAAQDQNRQPQWDVIQTKPSRNRADRIKTKPAYGPNTVSVCLYRSKGDLSSVQGGVWTTRIGPGPEPCEEKLIADLDTRRFYFDFDSARPFMYQEDNAAWTAPKNRPDLADAVDCQMIPKGYHPCRSIFYSAPAPTSATQVGSLRALTSIFTSAPTPGLGRYRVFASNEFERFVLHQPKTIEMLEMLIAEKEAKATIQRNADYTSAFDTAKTLVAIAAFENRYRGNDPDNLIPKLEPLKLQLETKQYQDRFDAAKSSTDLKAFIADYESKDPDRLIPEARKRLAVAVKLEQAERDRNQREQAIAQKHAELGNLESRITNCSRMTAQANRAIAREREIGAVSGYVNTSIMREAGEYIVTCRSVISDTYVEYRKAGGTKTIGDLK